MRVLSGLKAAAEFVYQIRAIGMEVTVRLSMQRRARGVARLKLKEDLLNLHLGSTSFFSSQICCFAAVVLDVRLTEQFRKDLTAAPKACSVRKNSSFSNLSSQGAKV